MEQVFPWFVLLLLGFFSYAFLVSNKCPDCGSLKFPFLPDKEASIESGLAFHVCRSCGHKEIKGEVDPAGKVVWDDGSKGYVDRQGKYGDLPSPPGITS